MTTFRDTSVGDPDRRRSIIVMDVADSTAMTVTGVELTNSQPAHVAIVDGSGTQITSFGGGTQYAEGATTSPATGTLAMGRYDATPPSLADGALYGLQLDSAGALIVSGGGGGVQYDAGDAEGSATGTLGLWLDNGSSTYKAISSNEPMPVDITGSVTIATPLSVRIQDSSGDDLNSDGANSLQVRPVVGVDYVSSSNPMPTRDAMPTTLLAFITDIPTATTRVQLASNTVVNGIVIEAASTNTGNIYVGGATVSSTVYGAILAPGQSVGLAIDNTNKVYVDTATNGNDVAVLGS